MRLERLKIVNFRNLPDVDVRLSPGTVIVGENGAGKSNLLRALRLVLDATLPNSERQLRPEDFWDGLSTGKPDWSPIAARAVIEVSVELGGFDDNTVLLAVLADALVSESPALARITYRFAPRPESAGETKEQPDYEWRIFGGENEDLHISGDLRGYLHLVHLHALRDVAGDIANWRRSPLRQLLEAASATASSKELREAAEAIGRANAAVGRLEPVKRLGVSISQRTREMVGTTQSLEAELGIAPLDPLRLLRDLRLFIDGERRRPIESASLGTLNVLYLALLELGLEKRVEDSNIAYVVMAIEEPEAHLHPHLQRLVFRRLLRSPEGTQGQTTIVTTHSPHIASVAPPKSLIVLRNAGDRTLAAVAADAALSDKEWEDIERYLDATRAELVFARKVLLVEGFVEQLLVPVVATGMGVNLDQLGISVCAIHGTHFTSYVRFLTALKIPWAVVTDGDPDDKGASRGVRRAERLAKAIKLGTTPEDGGIFVGDETIELDLYKTSKRNAESMRECLVSLLPAGAAASTVLGWKAAAPDSTRLIAMVEQVGKGRLAQRLASQSLDAPRQLSAALRYLAKTDARP